MSPFSLQPTPYGGRGIFASRFISKDTLLHTCETPYGSVIYRVFRKEVCGNCFSYAFDNHRNAWNIKAEIGSGVWFCSEDCKVLWLREQNIDGLLALMNTAVDKLAKSMRKTKVETASMAALPMKPGQISQQTLDLAWKNAESSPSRSLSKTGLISPSSDLDVVLLDEMEVETARFMISVIVKRYLEDTNVTISPSQDPATSSNLAWSDFMQLQDNELLAVQSRPHILSTQLRVYAFLRQALIPVLQKYVRTSEMVRAVFARDVSNAFGLWELSPGAESEMLGWGMYVSGSFFNHDCMPNLRKERIGRAYYFYTSRDVNEGDELCINYVAVADEVHDRRKQLLDNWYFDCACERCKTELELEGAGAGTGVDVVRS